MVLLSGAEREGTGYAVVVRSRERAQVMLLLSGAEKRHRICCCCQVQREGPGCAAVVRSREGAQVMLLLPGAERENRLCCCFLGEERGHRLCCCFIEENAKAVFLSSVDRDSVVKVRRVGYSDSYLKQRCLWYFHTNVDSFSEIT